MEATVKNIDDLRLEIYRLKGLKEQQGLVIRQRFSSPSAIFSSVFSLFPKVNNGEGIKTDGIFGSDLVQLASRFLLPFTLNKTLFRRSNFLIKMLVRIASQRVSRLINEKSVGTIWDKIKTLVSSKTKKENNLYKGIPD